MTDAVSRDTAHAGSAQGSPPGLKLGLFPLCTDDQGYERALALDIMKLASMSLRLTIRSVERDQPHQSLCDSSCDKLDDDGYLGE